jgi:hypothetical protein
VPPVEHDAPAAHRTEWRVERAGQGVIALALALAALGLFGEGPLARRARATADARATVRWERVARTGATTTVRVRHEAGGTPVRVTLPAALLAQFDVEDAVPAAREARATRAGLELAFALGAGGEASVRLAPRGPGRLRDTLRVDGAPVPLEILVLP